MSKYSSIKDLMDSETTIRQELTSIMLKDKLARYIIAKDIGISVGALDNFLFKRRSPTYETLAKIDEYITERIKNAK